MSMQNRQKLVKRDRGKYKRISQLMMTNVEQMKITVQ